MSETNNTARAAEIRIRSGHIDDLEAINTVIEAAVMGWSLPERVKRLSLPSYRYDVIDLDHLDLAVAQVGERIVGVAAWEPAEQGEVPGQDAVVLLHGLYVHPDWQARGIGRALLGSAREAAVAQGAVGLLVKAQSEATSFFAAAGLEPLPVRDGERDYAHRYWWSLA